MIVDYSLFFKDCHLIVFLAFGIQRNLLNGKNKRYQSILGYTYLYIYVYMKVSSFL